MMLRNISDRAFRRCQYGTKETLHVPDHRKNDSLVRNLRIPRIPPTAPQGPRSEILRRPQYPGLTLRPCRRLDEIRADAAHLRPMTSRQTLDRAVLKTTGLDIRLAGNWEPLESLRLQPEDLADELGVSASALRRCRDISDLIVLIDGAGIGRSDNDDSPSLFSSR